MPDPRPYGGPPTDATRPHRPWTVAAGGVLGLAAAAWWLLASAYFWYYHPALPMGGSVLFAVTTIVAWRGHREARLVATIIGITESIFYGPGGIPGAALFLVGLVMLYLPESNAYFRAVTRRQARHQ